MHLERYTAKHQSRWNDFVGASRNGTFLFHRGFMEYHRDRFEDHSLLVVHKDQPIAVFPASIDARNGVLASHAGLTYGGLIYGATMTQQLCVDALDTVASYARGLDLTDVHYKPVPHIYHRQPSEEDRYALFRLGAEHESCDVSSVLRLSDMPAWQERRRRTERKARALGHLHIGYSIRWPDFWHVLENRLTDRYQAVPVHSLPEIVSLAEMFPRNIKLVVAEVSGQVRAGIVLFVTPRTVRCQYIAADEVALGCGVTEALVAWLLDRLDDGVEYYDFGTSMLPGTNDLAEGVLEFKEGFGARTVVFDRYRIKL